MRRTFRKVLVLFLAGSIGVLWNGGEASAATVTIWPDQFEIDQFDVSRPPTNQNPDQLSGNSHYFYALRIPTGSTIKYIRVNYNSPPGTGYTFCAYLRRKTSAALAETLIEMNNPDPPVDGTISLQSDATHVTGPLKVKPGYRYYIQIEPGDEPGSINSVQVVYN